MSQSNQNMLNSNSSRNNPYKTSDLPSDRSNGGQTQSFSGMQTFSFIGNKNKYGKKEGFGIQKWKDGSTYKGSFAEGKAASPNPLFSSKTAFVRIQSFSLLIEEKQ